MALNLVAPSIIAYTTKTPTKSVVVLMNENPMTCKLVSSSGTSISEENINSNSFVTITIYEETKVYWTQNSDSSYNGSSPTTTIKLATSTPKLSAPRLGTMTTGAGYVDRIIYNDNDVEVTLYWGATNMGTISANSSKSFKFNGTSGTTNTATIHFEASGYSDSDTVSFNFVPSSPTTPKLEKPRNGGLVDSRDGYCEYRIYNDNDVSATLYIGSSSWGTIGANSSEVVRLNGSSGTTNNAYLHFEKSGYKDSDDLLITFVPPIAPTYYTVTINYKLSSSSDPFYVKTISKASGSDITSCLSVAQTYCPSGYTVNSVQPTSITNITSNRTINVLVSDNRPKLSTPSATLEETHDGYCVFRVYNSNSVAVSLYDDDTSKGLIGANSSATFNFFGTNDKWNQAFLHFEAEGYQNSDDYVINFKPTKIEFNFTVNNVGGVVDKACNLGSVPYSFDSEEQIEVSYITFTCQKAVKNFLSNWSVSRGTIASVEVSSPMEQQNYVKITFVSPISFSSTIGLNLSITYSDVENANFSVSGINNISTKVIAYQKDKGFISYDNAPFEMEKGSSYKIVAVIFTTTTTETISDIVSGWSSSLGTIQDVGVVKDSESNTQQITVTFASQPTLNYSTTSFTITYTKPTRTIDFSVSGVGGVVDKKINVLVSSGGPAIHIYPVPIETAQTDASLNVFGVKFTCQNDEVDNNLSHWSIDRGVINSVAISHNTVQQNEVEIGFSDYVELSFYNPTLAITFNKPKEKNYRYSLYSNIDDIDDIYLKDSTKDLISSELVVGTNKTLKYAGESVYYLTFSTKEDLTYEQLEVYYGNQMPLEERNVKKSQSGSKYIYEINFERNFAIYDNLYISINKVDISYTVNLTYRDKDKPVEESQLELDHLKNIKKGTILDPLEYKKDFAGYEFKYCNPSTPTEILADDTFYYYYEVKKGKKYKIKFNIENINSVAVSCEYNIILDNNYSISGNVNIEAHSIVEIEKIISTDYMEDKSMSVSVNAIFNADGYNSSQQVIENATYTPIE